MSERRALRLAGMSPSVRRYEAKDDRNAQLRQDLLALAHRHRRHGYRMLHLRLCQQGWRVNIKRVRCLYPQENLMVHKRKRKKVTPENRQPLIRPGKANEVWSMEFVFDRLAGGRSLKCMAVVDDATQEAVALTPDRAISGLHVARVLEAIKGERGLPKVIRSNNGKEFCGRAMAIWAHQNNVALRFIEPGKPNQNAFIERFNRSLRNELLDLFLFRNLAQVRKLVSQWRAQYDEQRPHDALGGLPPRVYATRDLENSSFELST